MGSTSEWSGRSHEEVHRSLSRVIHIPTSPLRPWRIAAMGALLLVVGGTIGFYVVLPKLQYCAAGVHRHDGECVGVTDGSFIYDSSLATVEKLIHDENAWVDDQRDRRGSNEQVATHVSIAYMAPMTGLSSNTDDYTYEQVRHELEGAYVAQLRANHPSTTEGSDDQQRPLIRLLLANSGEGGRHWQTAVEEIKQRRGAPDYLVAVAGLGHSVDLAKQAINRLSENRIGMVGSVITADDFSKITGFVRAAPTNSREVAAGMDYAKRQLHPTRAVLVKNGNRGDRYTDTLADQFERVAGASVPVIAEAELYLSNLSGVSNVFQPITANICYKHPDLIYFAGRAAALRDFLIALGDRACKDLPINIVSGDDASSINGNAVKASLNSGLSLFYTALAHPDDWAEHPSPSSTTFKQLFAGKFTHDSLADGGAIMAFDAVWTCVKAIKLASGQPADNPPGAEDVIQFLYQLHDLNAVQGASGVISIGADGNPKNKTVIILRLEKDGTVKYISRAPTP